MEFMISVLFPTAAAYTPFFKEVWERKADTESAFPFSESEDSTPIMEREPSSNHHLPRRLPAVLPKPPPPKRYDSFTATNKSSTSNRWVYLDFTIRQVSLMIF